MKRIVIIGSGGSGKSTFARRLGKDLGIPVVHLDALYWKPGWVPEEQKTFDGIIQAELAKEKWIIDGNFSRTMDVRIAAADTIIFIDLPRLLCTYRVVKRWLQYRNKTRVDMGEGCSEKVDLAFLKWVWTYPATKRPEVIRKLEQVASDKKVVHLTSQKNVKGFLNTL
ncbi:DNA topology modulation protein [Aureibacillus halotolerans]|uniref:Adenylate kinase family enzyme n=1 Tax=Aureibacillus halotolerans TaxID=1508390 RepID=A0A4R6U8B8_9BACI|nr:DNA topology modulation protein [Aureibacillus halotolerans]TDQ42820.1 adenylate kinase family enzyme [Aureibacillus halotolerans]